MSSCGCIGGQMCRTCPTPSRARCNEPGSVRSPTAISDAPACSSSGPASGRLSNALTIPPFAAAAATARRPVLPEAPVIRIGFVRSIAYSDARQDVAPLDHNGTRRASGLMIARRPLVLALGDKGTGSLALDDGVSVASQPCGARRASRSGQHRGLGLCNCGKSSPREHEIEYAV